MPEFVENGRDLVEDGELERDLAAHTGDARADALVKAERARGREDDLRAVQRRPVLALIESLHVRLDGVDGMRDDGRDGARRATAEQRLEERMDLHGARRLLILREPALEVVEVREADAVVDGLLGNCRREPGKEPAEPFLAVDDADGVDERAVNAWVRRRCVVTHFDLNRLHGAHTHDRLGDTRKHARDHHHLVRRVLRDMHRVGRRGLPAVGLVRSKRLLQILEDAEPEPRARHGENKPWRNPDVEPQRPRAPNSRARAVPCGRVKLCVLHRRRIAQRAR
eukprot:Amastigsp_a2310_16.p2 type:complete len:282 gc:universal Amastigsp_a2310_16:1009-164(-)